MNSEKPLVKNITVREVQNEALATAIGGDVVHAFDQEMQLYCEMLRASILAGADLDDMAIRMTEDESQYIVDAFRPQITFVLFHEDATCEMVEQEIARVSGQSVEEAKDQYNKAAESVHVGTSKYDRQGAALMAMYLRMVAGAVTVRLELNERDLVNEIDGKRIEHNGVPIEHSIPMHAACVYRLIRDRHEEDEMFNPMEMGNTSSITYARRVVEFFTAMRDCATICAGFGLPAEVLECLRRRGVPIDGRLEGGTCDERLRAMSDAELDAAIDRKTVIKSEKEFDDFIGASSKMTGLPAKMIRELFVTYLFPED